MIIENLPCTSCREYGVCAKPEEDGHSLRKCQRVIEELYYPGIKDKDVLEIGCGTSEKGGSIKRIVQGNGCRWTGIDIKATDLATHVCSVEKMPFGDNSFDWVIGSQTIEHWKRPVKALKETRRVLRPGGKVSLTAPVHLHGSKNFVRGDLAAVARMFERCGFKIEEFQTWRKDYGDLGPNEPNDYAKKYLRKFGITDYDGMSTHIIHCLLSKNEVEMKKGFFGRIFGGGKITKIADCIDREKGKTFLIVGAGGSLREYEKQIKGYIEESRAITIGINYMTEFCIPDYHLWTNQQRYRDLGQCISEHSRMIFGHKMPKKLIRKHFSGDYISVDYGAGETGGVDYRDGRIYGSFRTAGTLAIMIAHLMGAAKIYVVGMDGFTLHGREQLESGGKNHHCYGKGYTDDASWQECVGKDEMVYNGLNALAEYGVEFSILTPTKFSKFHDSSVLSVRREAAPNE